MVGCHKNFSTERTGVELHTIIISGFFGSQGNKAMIPEFVLSPSTNSERLQLASSLLLIEMVERPIGGGMGVALVVTPFSFY